MQFRWQLAIFDDQFENLVPIEEYVRLHREGRANWIPNVEEDSGLFLEHEGEEWMASDWNLGRLDLIILQSEAALLKLKKGNEAIIRSAVSGVDSVPFLLLQPSNQEVLTSLFFVDDARANAFPIPKICGDSKALYAYLDKNRQQILRQTEHRVRRKKFKQLPLPKSELMASLEFEANLARQFIEMIGADSELLERYQI